MRYDCSPGSSYLNITLNRGAHQTRQENLVNPDGIVLLPAEFRGSLAGCPVPRYVSGGMAFKGNSVFFRTHRFEDVISVC